jgi:hypothetical protein
MAVAEYVMGYKWLSSQEGCSELFPPDDVDGAKALFGLSDRCVFSNRKYYGAPFSGAITFAWEVVSRMSELGFDSEIGFKDGKPFAHFFKLLDSRNALPCKCVIVDYAETVPEAICLAALEAVGHPFVVEEPVNASA